MATKKGQLNFIYDQEGDVLDIAIGASQAAITKEVDDDVFVRMNKKTNAVVGFMILNFSKRFKQDKRASSIPVTGNFELAAKG